VRVAPEGWNAQHEQHSSLSANAVS
jgi:hypothetical protein